MGRFEARRPRVLPGRVPLYRAQPFDRDDRPRVRPRRTLALRTAACAARHRTGVALRQGLDGLPRGAGDQCNVRLARRSTGVCTRAHPSPRPSAGARRSRTRTRAAGSALHVVHALGADRVSAGSCGGGHRCPRPRSTERAEHRRVRRLRRSRELCSPSIRGAPSVLPCRPRGCARARAARQGHVAPSLAWRSGPRARNGRPCSRGPRTQHRLLPELPARRHQRRKPGVLPRPERADPRDRHRARASTRCHSRSGWRNRASSHPRRARVRAADVDGHDRVAAPGIDLRRHARRADALHVLPRSAVGSVLPPLRRPRLAAAPDTRSRVARLAYGGAHDSADQCSDRTGKGARARALRCRTDPAGLQRPRGQDLGRALPRSPGRDRARHGRRVGPPEARDDRCAGFCRRVHGRALSRCLRIRLREHAPRAADIRRRQSVVGRRAPIWGRCAWCWYRAAP